MKQNAEWKKLFYSLDQVKYEGFTISNKPFGAGTTYYPDGTIFQEGVFDIKGLVYGREYYPTGSLRFEGTYRINNGYGPNYPVYGKCYDESGNEIFSGQLSLTRSGLGYPRILEPEQYGEVVEAWRPDIEYFMWDDLRAQKARETGEPVENEQVPANGNMTLESQKEPTYEEFFNDVRARLIRGRSLVSTEEEIDNYLNTDADAKEEIEEKYNKAIETYRKGETTYNKIFTHYAASAASCLDWMY